MKNTPRFLLLPAVTVAGILVAGISGCASPSPASGTAAAPADKVSVALDAMRRDFQAKGIAGMDRLKPDTLTEICNQTGNRPDPDRAAELEAEQLAAIKFPADGKFMGDWKAGESLAQSGRGMTWTDKADTPNGGNCYNCHRMSPKELSYGTIGPSLLGYGKLHGNGLAAQKATWSQIYNAKAFAACSAMPRFGHVGAFTEKQIKDLVALLLDPESPVNQ